MRNLARQLGDEFGNGVSVANLRNFRQFYLTFPDARKRYTLCSELSWSHGRLIQRRDSSYNQPDLLAVEYGNHNQLVAII
jgi:hypothetical protein